MRAALDDLAATAPGRRVAVLGDMLELGAAEEERYHRELGARGRRGRRRAAGHGRRRARPGPARRSRRRAPPRRATPARRPRAAARRGCAPATPCSSRARAASRSSASRPRSRTRLMGEILIGGTAALLICIFLSPKFIEFLRRREFGQHVRDDGPQGHLGKAGTPTMGGIIVMIAVVTPFAILSNWNDWRAIGVFGAMLACALHRLRRRLHEDRQAPLARPARAHEAGPARRDLGRAVARRQARRPSSSRDLDLRFVDTHIDLGAVLPGADLPRRRRDDQRRQPDRRPRRPRRRLRGDRRCSPTSRSPSWSPAHHQLELLAACIVGACVGFLWFNAFPATIFMGDTGSLGLGGAIAGLAVMTQTEMLLILIGGIFVIEALSVLIQIVSFQVVPQARLPDGAAAPPLRAEGVVGDEDHPALLDHRDDRRRDRLHDLLALDQGSAHDRAGRRSRGGPYLVVGLARSGTRRRRSRCARAASSVLGSDRDRQRRRAGGAGRRARRRRRSALLDRVALRRSRAPACRARSRRSRRRARAGSR